MFAFISVIIIIIFFFHLKLIIFMLFFCLIRIIFPFHLIFLHLLLLRFYFIYSFPSTFLSHILSENFITFHFYSSAFHFLPSFTFFSSLSIVVYFCLFFLSFLLIHSTFRHIISISFPFSHLPSIPQQPLHETTHTHTHTHTHHRFPSLSFSL